MQAHIRKHAHFFPENRNKEQGGNLFIYFSTYARDMAKLWWCIHSTKTERKKNSGLINEVTMDTGSNVYSWSNSNSNNTNQNTNTPCVYECVRSKFYSRHRYMHWKTDTHTKTSPTKMKTTTKLHLHIHTESMDWRERLVLTQTQTHSLPVCMWIHCSCLISLCHRSWNKYAFNHEYTGKLHTDDMQYFIRYVCAMVWVSLCLCVGMISMAPLATPFLWVSRTYNENNNNDHDNNNAHREKKRFYGLYVKCHSISNSHKNIWCSTMRKNSEPLVSG